MRPAIRIQTVEVVDATTPFSESVRSNERVIEKHDFSNSLGENRGDWPGEILQTGGPEATLPFYNKTLWPPSRLRILDGLEVTLAGSIAGEWQGAVDVASILLRARLVPTPDLAVSGGIPAFSRSERAHGEFNNQPRRCAAQGEESLRPDRPTLAPKQKDLHPQMK